MKQVEYVVDNENQVDSWQEVTLVYSAALKQINTKLEILNDEFQHVHRYNPIEHIKSRMKTSESIVKKLKRYGYESTIENMVKYINDIAGIRVIDQPYGGHYPGGTFYRAEDTVADGGGADAAGGRGGGGGYGDGDYERGIWRSLPIHFNRRIPCFPGDGHAV